MKTSIAVVVGIVIGVMAGIFLSPYFTGSEQNSNQTIVESSEKKVEIEIPQTSSQFFSKNVREITPKEAAILFRNYHLPTDLNGSKGCLKTTDSTGAIQSIISFYIPFEGFLNIIGNRVQDQGKTFLGLAGIPAYDNGKGSHTIIWAPVIDEKGAPHFYFENPAKPEVALLFDYTAICPDFCPENRELVWTSSWR